MKVLCDNPHNFFLTMLLHAGFKLCYVCYRQAVQLSFTSMSHYNLVSALLITLSHLSLRKQLSFSIHGREVVAEKDSFSHSVKV